ncbi:hypothetical protein J7302_13110 [Pseudomonas sp. DB1]|uniref:Uncharacterized protein n=1 Tax=Metapseudomonas boanensis TaxID=2822138 RepID=A0ABS5XH86_9GAMM|nr:hypothetical protein [Pseudomonas boanensis]
MASGLRFADDFPDPRRNVVHVGFEGKVTGVQQFDDSVRVVALERLGARRDEERVVFAPDDQLWHLRVAEEGLELWLARQQ